MSTVDQLTLLVAEVRKQHRWLRAHPDPAKRPEYMECECGAMIPVMMCEPWDAFELHRAQAIVERLDPEQMHYSHCEYHQQGDHCPVPPATIEAGPAGATYSAPNPHYQLKRPLFRMRGLE